MNNKKLFFSGKRLNCYVRNPIWMYRENEHELEQKAIETEHWEIGKM